MERAFAPILDFPQAGGARDSLGLGLRSIVEGKYVLFYRYNDRFVTIVRVLHGSRDIAALAKGGALD